MKIFTRDKVYVQKKDLKYLMHRAEGIAIPASIFDKVFGRTFIVTDKNRYEFIEFTSKEEIDFFKKCTFMVDYNELDNMTTEEIIDFGQSIAKEKNKKAEEFNELPENEREKKYNQIMSEIELLEFKIHSTRDVLWHKQGLLDFALPEDVEPNYLKTQEEKEVEVIAPQPVERQTMKEEKKHSKLFQKLIDRLKKEQ